MDFFADGGFQQLFSDLHAEQQLDFPYTNTCDVYAKIVPTYSSGDDSCQMLDIYTSECCYGHSPLQDAFCNYDTYVDEAPFEVEVTQYLCDVLNVKSDTSNASDESINIHQFIQEDKQHLESSLELLLPAELDTVEATTFSTTEMPEWEELLDHCIEIPELVDFLPEKTPLCNEMCDLFLQESSKNLQLFHKPKLNLYESVTPPEKGYACSFGACQKIYAKPAHLKAHLRRHLGEKPYICSWTNCTWKFSRSDELARHRRSHSGVKPYKCDYCTKCFARSDHLTKHRKVHERRMLAASKAGKAIDGVLPNSVYTVRPGRKRKNQIC